MREMKDETKIDEPASSGTDIPDASQSLRHLARTAILLGMLSILAGWGVGFYSYFTSRNATLESIYQSNLDLARSLSTYASVLAESAAASEILIELEKAWEKTEDRYPGRYLCLVDADGKLLLNTAGPDKVGMDVGENRIQPRFENDPHTLRELLVSKRDWVGKYWDLAGREQVVAFAHSENLNGLVAVHVPSEVINAQIRAANLPWATGIGVITFVLLPLALGFLYRAYSSSQRQSENMNTILRGEIAERQQVEEALRVSGERLRSVVDNMVDGITTIDDRGIVQSFNAAAENIFGYTAAEVIGENVKMLMPEPYQAEHDTYMANHLNTGEKKIIGIGREIVGRRKDGEVFPVDLAVSEFHIDGQRFFSGIIRDVSERKRLEAQLIQAQSIGCRRCDSGITKRAVHLQAGLVGTFRIKVDLVDADDRG